MCDHWHLCLVNFISIAQSCLTLCDPMDCSMPGFPITNSRSLLKLISIESVMHSTISSFVVLFSSCLQSFIASGSFPVSQFFASWGQSIGVSATASVLPMSIQDWFPLGWTGCLLAVQGILKSLLQHHSSKASILWRSAWHSAHWDGGRQIVVVPFYTWGKETLMKLKLICPGPGTNKWLSRNSLTDIFTPNFYIPSSL